MYWRQLNKPCILQNAFAAALICIISPQLSLSATVEIDSSELLRLQETVRQQQEQLSRQSESIRERGRAIEELKRTVDALPLQPSVSIKESPQRISSGNSRINLAISGQINRAINIASDGGSTKLYHVDNSASGTRVRFVGKAIINSTASLGSRLEFGIAPDRSSMVSQTDQTPSEVFTTRWADVSLQDSRFGKISIGKGDTASKGSAMLDLSRTDVVQYSSIASVAGGLRFRHSDFPGLLTETSVRNSFRNYDGLGRQSRLRYDTPQLWGFTLSGSLATKERSDIALYWAGEGYGFKALAAGAIANPKLSNGGLLYDGSVSILHDPSGLNATFSGAIQKNSKRKDATNLYAKLGWIARFTTLGPTAFGVDYTNSGNLPADDDRGYSYSGAVVQSFDRYATELYFQYRRYRLERNNLPAVNDIQVSTLGVRVKF